MGAKQSSLELRPTLFSLVDVSVVNSLFLDFTLCTAGSMFQITSDKVESEVATGMLTTISRLKELALSSAMVSSSLVTW